MENIRERLKGNKELVDVHMKISKDLFEKSKAVIPNRTQDYVDHLNRKLEPNREKNLKSEIEIKKAELEGLKQEYNQEQEMREKKNLKQKTEKEKIESALNTVHNIIENEGNIGLDKLEAIAAINNVSMAKLREKIDESKISNFHLTTKQWNGD